MTPLEVLTLTLALLVATATATWKVASTVSARRAASGSIVAICRAHEEVAKHEAAAQAMACQLHDHLREDATIRREQHRDVQQLLMQQTAILQKLTAILERQT